MFNYLYDRFISASAVSYSFGFWISIHSFYKHGMFFGQPKYVFFSASNANKDLEENGGNVYLRVLVFVGIKNFSVDL